MFAMNETHPMRPIEFLVLAALNERDRHGYALVKEIEARTGGRTRVKPGNLYRVLDRLVSRGLVGRADESPAPELADARRRYYRITETGRTTLRTEAQLLGAIADEVRGLAHKSADS
jgi:DNA-binding PadR family transcriptional regulator